MLSMRLLYYFSRIVFTDRFLSNESSKSYFFQQHMQDIFNLRSESFMQNCGSGDDISGPRKFKSIKSIDSYVESCILQNPKITYKNATSLTPITATIQPDHMVVILGKVLYESTLLSTVQSLCQMTIVHAESKT